MVAGLVGLARSAVATVGLGLFADWSGLNLQGVVAGVSYLCTTSVLVRSQTRLKEQGVSAVTQLGVTRVLIGAVSATVLMAGMLFKLATGAGLEMAPGDLVGILTGLVLGPLFIFLLTHAGSNTFALALGGSSPVLALLVTGHPNPLRLAYAALYLYGAWRIARSLDKRVKAKQALQNQ